jgi:hypothetical protein
MTKSTDQQIWKILEMEIWKISEAGFTGTIWSKIYDGVEVDTFHRILDIHVNEIAGELRESF